MRGLESCNSVSTDTISSNKNIPTSVNSRLPTSIQESISFHIDKLKLKHYFYSFIANNYPSEILEGRLYLGDANHASDKTILQNLKITHILNVTNNIPCFFEDDRKILSFLFTNSKLYI
jgi:hypothetical protein